MGILIVILLIWAAVAGVLWQVLKIAAGVALGVFFAGLLLAGVAWWGFRRAMVRRGFGRARRRR
ncbi:MAG TPA: hypothetical protein VEA19_03530 [Actinomycetota bacterium]|nr:hypothetical protein [Actinomycetota bacterium]